MRIYQRSNVNIDRRCKYIGRFPGVALPRHRPNDGVYYIIIMKYAVAFDHRVHLYIRIYYFYVCVQRSKCEEGAVRLRIIGIQKGCQIGVFFNFFY